VLGEVGVLNHLLGMEFFAADDIVFFGEVGGNAAVVSRSLPPHLQMFSLQFPLKVSQGSLFSFALRQPFDFFNLLLQLSNAFLSLDKVFRVIVELGSTVGIGSNKQVSDADINADSLPRFRQRFDNLFFGDVNKESNPVSIRFARQTDNLDFAFRQRFVKTELDNSDVGKLYPTRPSVKLPKVGSLSELINKGAEFTGRLEFREVCLFLEETLNGIRKAFANSKIPSQRVDFIVTRHLFSKVEPNLIQVVIGKKLDRFISCLPALVNPILFGKQVVVSTPTPPQKVVYLFSLLTVWFCFVLRGYYHLGCLLAMIIARR